MTLYVEQAGVGPQLVLLHGWGYHSGAWRSLVHRFAACFRVTLVDLPGHGRSEMLPQGQRLEEVAKAIAAAVPSPAFWLGWSLGGLVALQVAIQFPQQVDKLVLVASTPRFVSGPDWSTAVPSEVFAGFEKALEGNLQDTLQRFVLLQSQGAAQAKKTFQWLSSPLSLSLHLDNKAGLKTGLVLLRESDLRAGLGAVRCPTLVIRGEQDRLVPPQVGEWLCARLPQGRLYSIPGAGHVPFLSHPKLFAAAVEHFLAGGRVS
jgi:pimeloyl-[acyl-carrier protein] methyl ester esterase